MEVTEPLLDELAGAILDGTPIDWASAEAAAREADRALLDRLKILAALGDMHRDDSFASLGTRVIALSVPASPPQRWGPLRVLEPIGRGAFGEVYRAWDTTLDREVALKLLPARSVTADAHADSIIEEGRLLARVRHPNVVTIYGAERIGDRIGLWMELVRGRTLEQALEEGRAFSASEAIEIGIELCRAVAAVHGAGLLHRDIKAHNVMLAEDGRVVLMDFGAGRRLDDACATDLAGTPLYLAPEVLQGREGTVRSDVYSLGVLLYHIITKSYPVQARSLSELHLAHARRLRGEQGSGLALHPNIPARLAALLERATDPRPERRHESTAALAGNLQALQRGRNAHAWSGALAALIVVAVATVWLLAARGSDRFHFEADSAAGGLVAPAREPVRLAVLPFVIAGDSDSDVLRDGIARDLIGRLQAYENARVMSRESVFSAAALDLPLSEIGARLGVSAILTGSFVRSGDTVAVEAQLVRVPDEHTLWKGQYIQAVAQILEAQRAIVLDLAGALGLQRQGAVPGWPTRDLKAYTLYVRGMTALDRFTREGTRVALQLFEQALELDPDYAQAHAGLALVHLQIMSAVPNLSGDEALRRATEAAARAMALDESLPEAHVAAASIKSVQADWNGAERDYQRAIELGASNVLAHQQYARWLSLLGRFDEAVDQARMAESLDPLSPRAIMAVASALRFARRFEEAIPQARKALALDPTYSAAFLNLGHNYQGLGRLDEAIDAFERIGGPSGNLGHAYALAGRTNQARALISHFEQEHAKTGLFAGEIAQIYSGLGEIDRAFEWLDRMGHFHAGWPTTFKVAPVWDPLRSDPRFTARLRKYGLAD